MSFKKIEAFCIDENEKLIFAGNYSGQILTIQIEDFNIIDVMQIHMGSIHVVCKHPRFPYIATLGMDGFISILRYNRMGQLTLIQRLCTRPIRPANDEYARTYTTTQALCFHPCELRLAGHGGSAGVFESVFSEDKIDIISCIRIDEPYDPITLCYVDENSYDLLVGNNRGQVFLINEVKLKKHWDFGKNNNYQVVHWFEKVSNRKFYIASDAQKVIFLDLIDENLTFEGPIIAKDHLEHVNYNKNTKKLYASSFDRNIYEVNIKDCSLNSLIWEAPFKIRWIKALEYKENEMIVNCRNGALYKIDIHTKKVLASIKQTPDALWSGEIIGDQIIIAGESNRYAVVSVEDCDEFSDKINFHYEWKQFNDLNKFYTKRVAVCEKTGMTAFGRSNGKVIITCDHVSFKTIQLSCAVRDLVFSCTGEHLYAVNEDGLLYDIDVSKDTVTILYHSSLPLWAMALSDNGKLLAIADRVNNIHIYNLDDSTCKSYSNNFRFIKRIKWIDNDKLMIGNGGTLSLFELSKSTFSTIIHIGKNTIEDFFIDKNKEHIVLISYTKLIYLVDATSGELLHQQAVGHDYTKGLVYLNAKVTKSQYLGDFITFGRDGIVMHHRIYDEMITTLGIV